MLIAAIIILWILVGAISMYLGARYDVKTGGDLNIYGGRTWTNGDVVAALLMGAFFGPISVVTVILMALATFFKSEKAKKENKW